MEVEKFNVSGQSSYQLVINKFEVANPYTRLFFKKLKHMFVYVNLQFVYKLDIGYKGA